MDKIIIKGLKIYAYHGVKEKEKVEGQNFFIDCEMLINIDTVRFNDDIESTINYSKASKLIIQTTLNKCRNLIETAAEDIAFALFNEFDKLLEVEITVKKPEAPIKNVEFSYVAVSIKRKRSDFI